MISSKIRLNAALRDYIRSGREVKQITIKELSEMIGKTSSYISLLENNRIQSSKTTELVNLIKLLYNVTDEEAISKIETLLLVQDSLNNFEKNSLSNNKKSNIKNYIKSSKFNLDENFNSQISNLCDTLRSYYDTSPEDAERMLQTCIKSFNYDIGFMTSILTLPYFALESLSYDQRQVAFDDITSAFHKHYLLAKANINTDTKENTSDE